MEHYSVDTGVSGDPNLTELTHPGQVAPYLRPASVLISVPGIITLQTLVFYITDLFTTSV